MSDYAPLWSYSVRDSSPDVMRVRLGYTIRSLEPHVVVAGDPVIHVCADSGFHPVIEQLDIDLTASGEWHGYHSLFWTDLGDFKDWLLRKEVTGPELLIVEMWLICDPAEREDIRIRSAEPPESEIRYIGPYFDGEFEPLGNATEYLGFDVANGQMCSAFTDGGSTDTSGLPATFNQFLLNPTLAEAVVMKEYWNEFMPWDKWYVVGLAEVEAWSTSPNKKAPL